MLLLVCKQTNMHTLKKGYIWLPRIKCVPNGVHLKSQGCEIRCFYYL